jgi:hypothetical protein
MVDAVGIIVGIVIGAGIFKPSSNVAATAGSKTVFLCSGLGPIRKMNLMNRSSTT